MTLGLGPQGALTAQHTLARWWRTPTAQAFAEDFGRSMMRVSRSALSLQHDTARHIPVMEARSMPHMPTYSVSADMVTLVEAAAQSYPGQPLHAEDLPSPSGFVLFDRGIDMLDVHANHVEFRAFTWETESVQRVNPDGSLGNTGRGIFLAMYSGLDNVVDYPGSVPPVTYEDAERVFGPAGLALLHIHGVLFEVDYDLPNVPVLQNHLVFIESLFAVMQQQLTVTPRWTAPRGQRRTIERETGDLPDVKVIMLRRLQYREHDDDEEPGFVEWSHRWLVSGHWRRIWNEKRGVLRLVWIAPYVKGPEDKPLIVKDTVYRLSR